MRVEEETGKVIKVNMIKKKEKRICMESHTISSMVKSR